MLRIFGRRKKPPSAGREIARQFTEFQRQAFAYSSVPPGGLPYPVYGQMEQDSMVQTALSIKKQGILAAGYRIVPASSSETARRHADFVAGQFERMNGSPHTILLGAMDAFSKGWSAQELIWADEGGRIALKEVKPKDPSLFGLEIDPFGRVTGLRLEVPGEDPRALPSSKFVLYFNRTSYARAKGRSDLDAAHRHWEAKVNLMSAWKKHLERFASPTLLGKHDAGMPIEDQARLLSDLSTIQDRLAMIVEKETDVETIGGGRESSTGFIDAIDFHNREIARAILGQTLTTDEGRRVGSLALGKVHLQVLLLQLEGLRRELADVVMTEQVIRPMVELNFGPSEIPRFEFEPVMLSAFSTGEVK